MDIGRKTFDTTWILKKLKYYKSYYSKYNSTISPSSDLRYITLYKVSDKIVLAFNNALCSWEIELKTFNYSLVQKCLDFPWGTIKTEEINKQEFDIQILNWKLNLA